MNIPKNVAFSRNRNLYFELNDFQFSQCKGSNEKHCPMLFAQKSISQHSCISALMADSVQHIKDLCDFRFFQNGTVSQALELEPGQLLLFNVTSVTIVCPDKIKKHKGCMFCMLHVPCHCSIVADVFQFAKRITSCKNMSTEITKLFPVNLGLLHKFFSQEKLAFIQADTTFFKPLEIQIPPFKLFNHKFKNIVAADQKMHLNLNQMAARAKSDQYIYESLADPILSGEWDIDTGFEWALKPSFIVMVSMALVSVITAVCCIFLFHKYRMLSIAMLALQTPTDCEALTLVTPKALIWNKSLQTTTTVNTTEIFSQNALSSSTGIASVISLSLLIMVCIYY